MPRSHRNGKEETTKKALHVDVKQFVSGRRVCTETTASSAHKKINFRRGAKKEKFPSFLKVNIPNEQTSAFKLFATDERDEKVKKTWHKHTHK